MLKTLFYVKDDFSVLGAPKIQEAQETISVYYEANYSGEISLAQSINGKDVEIVTDFKTLNDIALDKNAKQLHDFTHPETGEVITVHVYNLIRFVSEAYKNSVRSTLDYASEEELLSTDWVLLAGKNKLPV